MPDYEKLYRIVFNGITDALDAIERENYQRAKEMLVKAQQAAEDYYVEDGPPILSPSLFLMEKTTAGSPP